jgi:hypothetical protein
VPTAAGAFEYRLAERLGRAVAVLSFGGTNSFIRPRGAKRSGGGFRRSAQMPSPSPGGGGSRPERGAGWGVF